jgi:hypothetical protein
MILPRFLPFLLLSSSNAYVLDVFGGAFKPKKELRQFSADSHGTVLNVHLDIGKEKGPGPRMSIQDIQLQLHRDNKNEKLIPMPGANGPHPKISSGVRQATVQKMGHFIDMEGTRFVNLAEACWEMIWGSTSPVGSLVCGFHLEETASRNSASLPAGLVYLTFPVWTAEVLEDYQTRKEAVERAAAEHLAKRDEELMKMQQTNNWFAKAMHYRNAAAEVELWSLQPLAAMARVPAKGDAFKVAENLFLSKKGTVWTSEKAGASWFGAAPKKAVIGTAILNEPARRAAS